MRKINKDIIKFKIVLMAVTEIIRAYNFNIIKLTY